MVQGLTVKVILLVGQEIEIAGFFVLSKREVLKLIELFFVVRNVEALKLKLRYL
jgi:hypothetical protein